MAAAARRYRQFPTETPTEPAFPMDNLKLIALDGEDLAVVSAHLQDAVLRVGDMAYLPKQKRFAALANRFDWQGATAAVGKRQAQPLVRRQCALRLERVRAARLQGIDLAAKGQVLALLAIQFEAKAMTGAATGEVPQVDGAVTLVFAGGAAIRLEVECIEAVVEDLGPAWEAKRRPEHGLDGDTAKAVDGPARTRARRTGKDAVES